MLTNTHNPMIIKFSCHFLNFQWVIFVMSCISHRLRQFLHIKIWHITLVPLKIGVFLQISIKFISSALSSRPSYQIRPPSPSCNLGFLLYLFSVRLIILLVSFSLFSSNLALYFVTPHFFIAFGFIWYSFKSHCRIFWLSLVLLIFFRNLSCLYSSFFRSEVNLFQLTLSH